MTAGIFFDTTIISEGMIRAGSKFNLLMESAAHLFDEEVFGVYIS